MQIKKYTDYKSLTYTAFPENFKLLNDYLPDSEQCQSILDFNKNQQMDPRFPEIEMFERKIKIV